MTIYRARHYIPIVISIFIHGCDEPNTSVRPPTSDGQKNSVARITRTPVLSSALVSVGYDSTRQILEIEFHNGDVYRYFDVPESGYAGLMSAESHGRYFHRQIRDAGYQYTRVTQ